MRVCACPLGVKPFLTSVAFISRFIRATGKAPGHRSGQSQLSMLSAAAVMLCWGQTPTRACWRHLCIRGCYHFLYCSPPGSHFYMFCSECEAILHAPPTMFPTVRDLWCSLQLWSRGLQRWNDCSYQLEGSWLLAKCGAPLPSLLTLWSCPHEHVLDVGGAEKRNNDCSPLGPGSLEIETGVKVCM